MRHLFLTLWLGILCVQAQAQENFLVQPYLQIGQAPVANSLELLWHSQDSLSTFNVEIKTNNQWQAQASVQRQKIETDLLPSFFVYRAQLQGLSPGKAFSYRILKNQAMVYTNQGKAPKSAQQNHRFICFGDVGAGTEAQIALAKVAKAQDPDYVSISGDIVYNNGLISEYTQKFWPIYNAAKDNDKGVSLMGQVPFFAAAGNHDLENKDLGRQPDAYAYYYFWSQPLNGPKNGKLFPNLVGPSHRIQQVLRNAGPKFPSMNNYSYDYANTHWLVIDADPHCDLTDPGLLAWIKEDLAQSKQRWKFVLFHHPGFNSSRAHYEQQQTRLLSPLFEAGGVDVVFAGHVHNYQRSYPLFFKPNGTGNMLWSGANNQVFRGRLVQGKWTLDKSYDGKNNKKAKGVIYLVTGAGGNALYDQDQTEDQDSWQKFTQVFYARDQSLTVVDVSDKKLVFKQLNTKGENVDYFELEK